MVMMRTFTMESASGKAMRQMQGRLTVLAFCFAIAFVLVGFRMVDVSIGSYGVEDTVVNDSKGPMVLTRRDIVDRHGNLLATSVETASLFANATEIRDPERIVELLRSVIPDLPERLIQKRLKSDRQFVWIQRYMTPKQQYEVNNLGIPGLYFRKERKRVYPYKELFAHVLGYAGADSRGLSGLEKGMDDMLRTPASAGQKLAPLVTSLDARVQAIVREELADSMQYFQAKGAAGLVMDPDSGEVLAMVSLPDFDPHLPGDASVDARFNRATLGTYEMGSTFKTFTTAMALDSGKVRFTDGFDATKPIRYGRHTIRDHHPKKRWMSVPEIFAYSSNIGTVKMLLKLGVKAQQDFLRKLGLLELAPIELQERGMPIVPGRWRDINAMTISFGHGLAVSPLHLVRSISAMVNGGTLYASTLVKRMEPVKGMRVISENTSEKIRSLMRLVVKWGTGSKADAEGLLVGGKTGTAEKIVNGRYKRDALMTTFVGAFPVTKPEYVLFVMLDEPRGRKETWGYATAGWNVAPTAGRIAARLGAVLGVPPALDGFDPVEQMFVHYPKRRKGEIRFATYDTATTR